MNTRTRLSFIGLIALLVLPSAFGRQESDRAIVDRFQNQVAALTKATEQAQTVQECGEISASIDALQQDFAPHKELLDKSLYPDDFDKTLVNLRGRLLVRQKDLGVIETQVARISELETQVRQLSDQVSKLTTDNEKLMSDVNRMGENVKRLGGESMADRRMIDSLKSVIHRLQRNLQERDQLIFALVDSIFQQYGKDVASMNDVEKQGVAGKVERRNVLTNIKKSINENLQFLESTTLKGTDFAEITKQQQKFSSQWSALGPKLTAVYFSGKKQKAELANIDTLLHQWAAKVDDATWRTLATSFREKGFSLNDFANGQQFFDSFSTFLDEQIRNAGEAKEDTRSKLFHSFYDSFWVTDLDPVWLPALVESGKLTDVQKKDLESKVEAWQSAVSPTSWVVYVLIAVVVVVLVWVAGRLLIRRPPKPVA